MDDEKPPTLFEVCCRLLLQSYDFRLYLAWQCYILGLLHA